MHWALVFIVAFLPLLEARQHVLSLNADVKTINPERHQPWSVLLEQHPVSMDCMMLSSPQQAQIHRAIQQPGDTLVIQKNLLNTMRNPRADSVMEILAYDVRTLWSKVSQLCSAIDYQLPPEVETYSEYEVV